VHGVSFKKRAPRAIKEIRAFAEKAMVCSHPLYPSDASDHVLLMLSFDLPTNHFDQGTSDVRLDPQLNKKVWESGIKGVPFRLRVRVSRKRNDEEGAKEKLYSYVQAVNVKNPKGLQTAVVEDA
jgi:large subunit ribosomal protein L31e